MILADLTRAFALISLPVAYWFGRLTIEQLMLVAALLGFATVFFDVAYQSYVPALVGPRLIARANGRLEATAQIARVGGPGLGGWLVGVAAAPLAFVFTASTYLFSAVEISRIDREEAPDAAPPPPLLASIKEGVDYVRAHPLLAPLFACIALEAFFSQGQFILFPVLVLRELGMNATTLGILMSTGAVGGGGGSPPLPVRRRRVGARPGASHAPLRVDDAGCAGISVSLV